MRQHDEFEAMTAGELETILCDYCRDFPLIYACPACEKQACLYCTDGKFVRPKRGAVPGERPAVICPHCGHRDLKGAGWIRT